MREKDNAFEMIFIGIITIIAAIAMYHFTEYEIEQQAKYEAEYCPKCKEETNETPNK